MNAVRKIVVLIIFSAIALIVWNFFIPYIREITRETLSDRLHTNTDSYTKSGVGVSLATTTLKIEIAATQPDRERGLGDRDFLEENKGMLFIFEKLGYHGIWMKHMLFPIDIAWLDEEFRIVDIRKNVSPNSFPQSFQPDLPARYVLEVNAGYFERHGIRVGETLKLLEDDKKI